MKGCDADTLSLYLDGELSLPGRRQVELHLGKCESCRRILDDLRGVDRAIAKWSGPTRRFNDTVEFRIKASVDRRRRLGPLLTLSRMMPAALGSSVAALLVVITASRGLLDHTAPPASVNSATPTHLQSLIKRQSAPLYKARATSAMFGVRSTYQIDQLARRHVVLEVE